MRSSQLTVNFTSKLWKYDGPAGWYFVSMPAETAKEVREIVKSNEQGWGRLSCIAKIENTSWKTAIWFDTKQATYLLPVKSMIRVELHLCEGDVVRVSVSF